MKNDKSFLNRVQSHWGSGVKFTAMSLVRKTVSTESPAVAEQQKDGTAQSSLKSWLLFFGTLLLLVAAAVSVAAQDYDNPVELRDGDDHSKRSFSNVLTEGKPVGNETMQRVKNINFAGTHFNCSFKDIHFQNCSFRGATLSGTGFYNCLLENCDFDSAVIEGAVIDHIDMKTFQTMPCYKRKRLDSDVAIVLDDQRADFSGWKFSNYGKVFQHGSVMAGKDWIFKDAVGVNAWMNREQFETTADYKKKQLTDCRFCRFGATGYVPKGRRLSFNAEGLSLAGFRLNECWFENIDDIETIDFTDAVLTDCCFFHATKITLAQIKQTWNYKTGNMHGIKLPPEIQKALDEEKKDTSPPR